MNWRDRLSDLPRLEEPDRIWRRVEQGPVGDGVPAAPPRGQRLLAAIVAIAVFAGAAVFSFGALREGPAPPGDDSPPPKDALVATLDAPEDGSIPFMELSYGGETASIHPQGGEWPGGPDAWTAELQPAPTEIPLGTHLAFVGDVQEVESTVRYGLTADRPTEPLDGALPDVPGDYVVEVLGTWLQGTAAFTFSVRIRDPEAVYVTWSEGGEGVPWVHAAFGGEDVELTTVPGTGSVVAVAAEDEPPSITVPAGTDLWLSGEATSVNAVLAAGRKTTDLDLVPTSPLPAAVLRDLGPGSYSLWVELATAQGDSTSTLFLTVEETGTASQQPVPPEDVVVPDVSGLPEEQAVALLADSGLESFAWYTWVDGVPSGAVGSSSPEGGTSVSSGTAVEIFVAVPGQRSGDGGFVFIERFQREHPGVLFGGRRGADGFPVAVFEPGQDPRVWVDELDAMISYPRFATEVCPVSTERLDEVVDELLRRSNEGLLESKGHGLFVDPTTCSVRLEGGFPPAIVAELQAEFGDLITIVDGLGPMRVGPLG